MRAMGCVGDMKSRGSAQGILMAIMRAMSHTKRFNKCALADLIQDLNEELEVLTVCANVSKVSTPMRSPMTMVDYGRDTKVPSLQSSL